MILVFDDNFNGKENHSFLQIKIRMRKSIKNLGAFEHTCKYAIAEGYVPN